ncbi:MAG: PilN domain-containing protein [Desulfobacterales bacterium]|nr:PilN domain-containing protein [Desulfobacterales bacterium]
MIRINLLPFRLARKKENIRRQLSVFLLSIVLVLTSLTWYSIGVDRKIARTKSQTESVKRQIALYKQKADRVTEIKKMLKILNEKLEIVASLQTRKDEQQILLEEMADRIVPERMWLESLKADATQVTVKGVAFDNPTIADFMRNLEKSPLFTSVDLKRSKIKSFEGDVDLKAFELVCAKKHLSPDSPKKGKK